MKSVLKALFVVAPVALLVPSAAHAGSAKNWDGTWSGMMNKVEPVSVTIAGGKVVAYTIRGAATPYPVEFSTVTRTVVSFGDKTNYTVKLIKKGDKAATGVAHSPMGDGLALLTKE